MEFELTTLALLALSALIAGFIDAIAGGGGLITLPALLAAGLTPAQALGTNKLQSSFAASLPPGISHAAAISIFPRCVWLSS